MYDFESLGTVINDMEKMLGKDDNLTTMDTYPIQLEWKEFFKIINIWDETWMFKIFIMSKIWMFVKFLYDMKYSLFII